jgi:hypothetical protein
LKYQHFQLRRTAKVHRDAKPSDYGWREAETMEAQVGAKGPNKTQPSGKETQSPRAKEQNQSQKLSIVGERASN